MKYLTVIAVGLSLALFLPSCGKEAKNLKEELRVIKEENNFLKAENIALKKEVEELYRRLEEREKARTAPGVPAKPDALRKETKPAAPDKPSDKTESPDAERTKRPSSDRPR